MKFEEILLELVIMVVGFGGFILPIIVGLLTPGRKGRMMTVKEVFIQESSFKNLVIALTERLQLLDFRIELNDRRIIAERDKRVNTSAIKIHTFEKELVLKSEIELIEQNNGFLIKMKMWTPDLVIVDTGESRFINIMIQQILEGNLDLDEIPSVQNSSFKGEVAIYSSYLLSIFCLMMPLFDFEAAKVLILSASCSAMIPIVMSILSMGEMWYKPKEIKWNIHVPIALTIAILSLVFAATFFFYTFYLNA